MATEKKLGKTIALKALIIFIACLAVLTFFSNTIMNYFIPKVVGSYVSRGNLSTDNSATGVIEIKNGAVLKGIDGRVISEVKVSNYDPVKKGDVLFKLEKVTDNSAISALQTELTSLEREQKYYEMQNGSSDYSSMQNAVKLAQANLEAAKKTLTSAKNKKKTISDAQKVIDANSSKVITYQAQVDSASSTIENLNADKVKVQTEIEKIDNQLLILETGGATIPEKVPGSSSDYQKNTPEYFVAQKQEKQALIDGYDSEITKAKSRLEDASAKLSEVNKKVSDAQETISNAKALPSEKEAQAAVDSAKAELTSAQKSLSDTKNQNKISDTQAKDQEKDRLKKIESLKADIAELEESYKSDEIVATCDGYVYDISVDVGDTMDKSIIASIIPENKECMVSFNFSKKSASSFYVGQVISCDDGYVKKCTITKIKPDPENPQENILVVCDVEGDLYPGYEIKVTASKSNDDYEQIVPASAINEDNEGQFVYVIVKETSVLGDRFNVKRVDVSVLATDGYKTAVSGSGLDDAYMVVTRSDEPLENGQRVRLTDYTGKDGLNE